MTILKIRSRFTWPNLFMATAALLFNNWLLGIWLNHRLLAAGGSVSELSVASQPYHWLFRLLDIASGLLLASIASLYLRGRGRQSSASRWTGYATLVLGIGNIADALAPLPCSGTLDGHCSAAISLSLSHFSIPNHAYSSTLIGICYLIAPIAGFIAVKHQRKRFTQSISLLTVIATAVFFILLIDESLKGRYVGSSAAGFSQVIQMLILGLWLIIYFSGWFSSANRRQKT